ncbi:hypothetical protein M2360_002900 [Rhizobium sp. SG_E_25_P2]|jgi:hypothetical protein|uniref:hypothetical protein n=1 Tax=Rhizobium sp. SG_E_25_P2 TaxID=2879942 RepID=UPI00247700C5|nr:hypothetical protein [Rhizobium sp. SG_E_25_P2]MDH6267503.1 hypothetical protein [Rhizobium sp. SG_E_25_P2]
MDQDLVVSFLAETFWGRMPNDAERVAMRGQMERDARAIAPRFSVECSALFGVEPSAFEALMRSEAQP